MGKRAFLAILKGMNHSLFTQFVSKYIIRFIQATNVLKGIQKRFSIQQYNINNEQFLYCLIKSKPEQYPSQGINFTSYVLLTVR